MGINTSKNLGCKHSQKLIDHAKQSSADVLETTSKRVIQKTAEAIGDLIGNKIADIIMKVSKTSPQNSLRDKEIPSGRYISRRKAEHY